MHSNSLTGATHHHGWCSRATRYSVEHQTNMKKQEANDLENRWQIMRVAISPQISVATPIENIFLVSLIFLFMNHDDLVAQLTGLNLSCMI